MTAQTPHRPRRAALPPSAEAVRRHFFDLMSKEEVDALSAGLDRVLDGLAVDARVGANGTAR